MKILITGFPGTGKSSVTGVLKERGHSAYDLQAMPGYMHVQDQITGRNIKQPEELPAGWYDSVGAYNLDPIKLQTLLDQHTDDIFICTLAHNQDQHCALFDKIFVLTLSNTTLKERLLKRGHGAIGKTPSEISEILELHGHFERSLQEHGAIKIDASPQVEEIVDSILSEL